MKDQTGKGEETMSMVEFLEDRCKGCSLCVYVCPKGIVKLRTDRLNSKGFHPAGVDEMEKCIGCAFCATICPDSIIEVEK
jgi:2-oxoglutarate ferredoxin oxidoreductase subunit delta